MNDIIDYEKYYENISLRENTKETNSLEQFRINLTIKLLRDNIKFLESKKILDLGCGDGEIICRMANFSRNCVGIDIAKNRLIKFKDQADRLGIKLIQGSIEKTLFYNEKFDVVICTEVLEHIEDYNKVLLEISRILKDKGYLLLSVPYKERINKLLCPYCLREFNQNLHLHFFDKDNFLKELNDNFNFKLIKFYIGPNRITRKIIVRLKLPFYVFLLMDYIFNLFYRGGTLEFLLLRKESKSNL